MSTSKITEFGNGMLLGGKPGECGSPDTLPEWTVLPNCCSEILGAEALWCSNDSFAPVSNLVRDSEPFWDVDRMTDQGKWMDGWETKRHNKKPYDSAILSLIPNAKCTIFGFCVDTSHFSGNHAPQVSIEIAEITNVSTLAPLLRGQEFQEKVSWKTVLEKTVCVGCYKNYFEVPKNLRESATHLRIKMYPDGGIARLRAHGIIQSETMSKALKYPEVFPVVDVAQITHGALVTHCTNSHFSSKDNMIKPNSGTSMKDGWETRRSRDIGHTESSIIQFSQKSWIDHLLIDTKFFVNNSPDFVLVEGLCLEPEKMKAYVTDDVQYTIGHDLKSESWSEILPKTEIIPNRKNYFPISQNRDLPFTHIRITMYPDGGISRVRVFGSLHPTKN